ncbi:MBOAT family O-acyltransferase [Bacillus sp. Hm123]|uniref:MBOAT family O-acyltransferase n=1 Tax=Bacillus sp. Hm123 TaxID=3450745 RepID=UPI003F4307FE
MVFSSLFFVFLFLPTVLLLYFIFPFKLKNLILLGFSLVFYAWGEPIYIFLMLISIVINYSMGLWIEKKHSLIILWIGILLNLSIFGYYKYSGFIIENINGLFHTSFEIAELPLPIGISFYTFQAISYLIDVYRKDTEAQKNLINLSLYISLFPQLVAGPIVRYKEINEQLKYRVHTMDGFYEGFKIFTLGLGKKVIIANQMGLLADTIFDQPATELTTFLTWIGIIAYTLQIYFDFSGYSEMALGLGKMFGFQFPRNFNYPYISKTVGEFWRRWHMTLGNFFRDYIYIPLGGSRVQPIKIYRNLFIVWLLTGVWHGASWNFIVWGLFYGVLIALERGIFGRALKAAPSFIQHSYVVLAFIIGWVFFRSPDLTYAIDYLQKMFSFDFRFVAIDAEYYWKQFGLYMVIGIVASLPIYPKLMNLLKGTKRVLIESAYILLLFGFITIILMTSSYNPFIYFKF